MGGSHFPLLTQSILTSNNTNERNLGLDIIRASAIMLVLLSHTVTTFYVFFSGSLETAFNIITWAGGFYGVELFFVLSGFLIGNIFIQKVVFEVELSGQLKPLIYDFWLRRWVRTIPSYLLFVAINILLIPLSLSPFDWNVFFQYLFFLQGFGANDTSFFGVSWSLAVEEWFYIAMPLIFVLGIYCFKKEKAGTAFFAAMLALLLLPLAMKIYQMLQLPALVNIEPMFHFKTLYKLDSIFYGVLLAWMWNKPDIKKWLAKYSRLLLVLGLLLLAASFAYAGMFIIKPLQKSVLVLLFGPLCSLSILSCFPFLLIHTFSRNNSIAKGITAISLCSYSLYLCHIPVVIIIDYFAEKVFLKETIWASSLIFSLRIIMSILIAQFLYRYFEIPVLSWRDKISNRYNAKVIK